MKPEDVDESVALAIERYLEIRAGEDVPVDPRELAASAINAMPKSDAQAQIDALSACVRRANEQAEKFEREWYLRGDEIEAKNDRLHELETLASDWKRAAEHHYGLLRLALYGVEANYPVDGALDAWFKGWRFRHASLSNEPKP